MLDPEPVAGMGDFLWDSMKKLDETHLHHTLCSPYVFLSSNKSFCFFCFFQNPSQLLQVRIFKVKKKKVIFKFLHAFSFLPCDVNLAEAISLQI